jgi:hypothetical protein
LEEDEKRKAGKEDLAGVLTDRSHCYLYQTSQEVNKHLPSDGVDSDMRLLEASLTESGRVRTLVPKAIDADDEDDPGQSDDDSSDEDEVRNIESWL